MGIIKRQSFKTSIINYAGVTLGMLFLNFVFPHIIQAEYLGLIGLIQGMVIVFSSITILGAPHVLVRFASGWSSERKAGFHTLAFAVITLAVLFFALVYLFFKQPIIAYYAQSSALFEHYFYLLIPLVLIFSYYQYLEMNSLVGLRTAVPSFLKEIVFRVILILSLFLIYYGYISYNAMHWVFVWIYAVPLLILAIYSFIVHDFKFGSIKAYLSAQYKELKQEYVYSFFMLLLVLTTNLLIFVDSLMLPAYLGLAQLAIYLRPQILGSLINIPYRAVAVISHPILRSKILNQEWPELQQLYKSIALNLFLFGSILAVALMANANLIFDLLPAEYAAGKSVLYIITLARLIDMAFGLNSELLIQSDYFKTNVYFSILAMVVGVVFNCLFIPMFGMNGAAWSVFSSVFLFNILKTGLIYKRFGFHNFSNMYWPVLLLGIVLLAIFHVIPTFQFIAHHRFMNALANIVLRGGVSVSLFVALAYAFRISPDFNQFVKTFVSGKLFKGGHKMSEL